MKKIVKSIIKNYLEGMYRLYEPCIKCGINPFM